MQRLYQWLSEHASFFRYVRAADGANSRVSTETTVRREGVTLLVGSAAALDLDICPFCGNNFVRDASESARNRLSGESSSQKSGS